MEIFDLFVNRKKWNTFAPLFAACELYKVHSEALLTKIQLTIDKPIGILISIFLKTQTKIYYKTCF